jgi:hypothetical protein
MTGLQRAHEWTAVDPDMVDWGRLSSAARYAATRAYAPCSKLRGGAAGLARRAR